MEVECRIHPRLEGTGKGKKSLIIGFIRLCFLDSAQTQNVKYYLHLVTLLSR